LILLDIQLPGMDGYEVLRRLRADASSAHVPVIAVSANAMPHDVARGRAAGFVDYLTKPLDMPRLIAAVEKVLAASSAR
jgi:CheY-like chemotaxis protein